jgi:hypothetical protein
VCVYLYASSIDDNTSFAVAIVIAGIIGPKVSVTRARGLRNATELNTSNRVHQSTFIFSIHKLSQSSIKIQCFPCRKFLNLRYHFYSNRNKCKRYNYLDWVRFFLPMLQLLIPYLYGFIESRTENKRRNYT